MTYGKYHPNQSKLQEKINWLKKNRELWYHKDLLEDRDSMNVIIGKMKREGLYAPTTVRQDTSLSIRKMVKSIVMEEQMNNAMMSRE